MQQKILSMAKNNSLATNLAMILGASLFIGVSARIVIPLSPVPLTLQPFAVLLMGALLGPQRSVLAVLAYISEGLLGLPFFVGASANPLSYLLGATGGYIIGFIPAAYLMGYLTAKINSKYYTLACMGSGLLATVSIYACGVSWLSLSIGFDNAIKFGLMPFIVGDIAKIYAVSVVLALLPRK